MSHALAIWNRSRSRPLIDPIKGRRDLAAVPSIGRSNLMRIRIQETSSAFEREAIRMSAFARPDAHRRDRVKPDLLIGAQLVIRRPTDERRTIGELARAGDCAGAQTMRVFSGEKIGEAGASGVAIDDAAGGDFIAATRGEDRDVGSRQKRIEKDGLCAVEPAAAPGALPCAQVFLIADALELGRGFRS